FDTTALKLTGEPHAIADPVDSVGTMGASRISVSTQGTILYSASGSTAQITWFDRTGKQLDPVGESGSFTYPFRLSPYGRRVVVTRDRPGGNDLWIMDADRGVANRLTSTSSSNTYP